MVWGWNQKALRALVGMVVLSFAFRTVPRLDLGVVGAFVGGRRC